MENHDFQRIEKAIRFIEANYRRQPSLGEIATHIGLSEFHCQRLFTRWAGVSPKRFVQFLTADYARQRLREVGSVLEASYEAGLSGPGRLHDLMVSVHAVTPGEERHGGEGLSIGYGVHSTPFGDCLICTTPRGICALDFLGPDSLDGQLNKVRQQWPKALFYEAARETKPVMERLFTDQARTDRANIALHVKGTNFQVKVWEALLKIPSGWLLSYEEVARAIEAPKAARAVGHAIAQNPVALLIPCHRVITKSGRFGEYHWGSTRKKAIVAWENARLETGR